MFQKKLADAEKTIDDYERQVETLEQKIKLSDEKIKHFEYIIDRYESAERALALSNKAHGVAMKMSIEKHVVVPES